MPEASGKSGRAGAAAAAPGRSSFKFPDPDRTIYVSVPPVSPPQPESEDGDGEGAEEAWDGLPKKLQLAHLPLLVHPVVISAIGGYFSEEECRTWIQWGERHGFEEAKQRQNAMFAHRDNGRIEFRSPEIAYQLWLRIRPFVPEMVGQPARQALGCSPRIRVYRYTLGQRFGQHIDESKDEPEMGGRTHFTVLVYLNGGEGEPADLQVRGGETIFWKDHDGKRPALAFPPTRGICLFHGHGDDCMTHEGALVEDGVKYVLRTDVVYEAER